jgi:hypothetical protein
MWNLISQLFAGCSDHQGAPGDNANANAQSQQQGPSNNPIAIEKENRQKENGTNDETDESHQKRRQNVNKNEDQDNTQGCILEADAFAHTNAITPGPQEKQVCRTKKRKLAPKKKMAQTSPKKKQKKCSKEKPKDPPNTTNNKITSTLEEDTLFETMGWSNNFIEKLLPLLKKLGVVLSGNSNRYSSGESFMVDSEEALRQHLCQTGIPKLLSQKERKFVELWVRYTHVPVSDLTSGYPQFSNEMIKKALVEELNLENKGGRFSKSNGEEIGTLRDVRVLLRSIGISGFGSIRNLEMNSQVNLRVWAARSTDPLPGFGRFTEKPSAKVWPILERTMVWTYPSTGKFLLECDGVKETLPGTSTKVVLQYCARNGIPGVGALSEAEKAELELSVRFAYVNRADLNSAQNGLLKLSNVVLSNEEIEPVLEHIRFVKEGGIFLAPGAKQIPAGDRQHKVHFFKNREEVRVYIREREFLAVDNDNRRSRRLPSGRPIVNADRSSDLFSLRLWAATSTTPLRLWLPPATSDTDNGTVFSTDDDEDNQKGMPAEREAVTEAANASTRNGDIDLFSSDSEDDDLDALLAYNPWKK